MEIVRGDNRDKSGINGDFLCIKGRYAFDFANHEDRLTQPLIRKDGQLAPSTWEEAFELIGKRFKEVREQHGGQAIGVMGSNRTTNEENYLLQKFARVVLQTNNIDHHRTADFPAFAAALAGKPEATATMRDVFNAPAILLIGNDPTEQHPLLAWQIRNNVRLHRAKLYVVNSRRSSSSDRQRVFCRFLRGLKGSSLRSWPGMIRRRMDWAGRESRASRPRPHSSNRPHRLRFANWCGASRIWSSSSARRFAVAILHRW